MYLIVGAADKTLCGWTTDLDSFMADGRLQNTIAGSFGLERIVKAHVAQESSDRIGNIVLEI